MRSGLVEPVMAGLIWSSGFSEQRPDASVTRRVSGNTDVIYPLSQFGLFSFFSSFFSSFLLFFLLLLSLFS